jgi:predicted transposase YbfD/YdcC
MCTEKKPSFLNHFSELEDLRVERRKLYPIEEILCIVLCATICGGKSWRDFESFGRDNLEFLREILPFKNGTPSKNFARFFASLDPAAFKRCFVSWMNDFQRQALELISIDGKVLRKSFDKASEQSPIHRVSAFASATKLVLAQEKVDDKSNEITAIPKLLDALSLTGTIVTIDAMGTQKEIAKKIREKQADYVLALKGNHSTLLDDISLFLSTEADKSASSMITDYYEEADKGHGRIEKRMCYVTDQLDWLKQRSQWADLKTAVLVESQVTVGDTTRTERRFFISSLPADAKQLLHAVRGHWAIENSLHWILDVSLREDDSRIRKDHAPENMATIRHITLNMLQNTKKHNQQFKNTSIVGLQRRAAWNNDILKSILVEEF